MHTGFGLAKAASGFASQRNERLEGRALPPGRALPAMAPA